MMAIFIVLSLTGFPQKFYDHRWAQVLIGWLGGVDTRDGSIAPRASCSRLLVVAHVVRLARRRRRAARTALSMVPTRQDFTRRGADAPLLLRR